MREGAMFLYIFGNVARDKMVAVVVVAVVMVVGERGGGPGRGEGIMFLYSHRNGRLVIVVLVGVKRVGRRGNVLV